MPPPVADDDQKRRARRRLIGAVALTLLAVILLPLVLEDEPPPAGRLEIHMPPSVQDVAAAQAPTPVQNPAVPGTIEFAPPAENTQVEPVEDAQEAADVSAAAAKPKPDVREAMKPLPGKIESAKAESAKAESPKAESPKPPPVASKPAEKPEAKPAIESEQKTSAENAAYSAQVGVFSDQANVEKLKTRIAALGLKAYTEQVGASTRVRVGKFSSRAQADEAVSKLKTAGLSAQVVEE